MRLWLAGFLDDRFGFALEKVRQLPALPRRQQHHCRYGDEIVRRRGQNPEAILPRTQMHSRRFMAALPATIIAFDAAIPEGGRRCSVSGH
jgi:hypothetical protein